MNGIVIHEQTRPVALQAILFFTLAFMAGESRSEAITRFIRTELCRSCGDKLTVGNVYGFATAGGYLP